MELFKIKNVHKNQQNILCIFLFHSSVKIFIWNQQEEGKEAIYLS